MDNFDREIELIKRDRTPSKDIERRAMFYIFAGNKDLFDKVDSLYNFEERHIIPECLEGSISLSAVETSLISLAFNLYNGYPADVKDVLYPLDGENFDLALNAMAVRFSRR